MPQFVKVHLVRTTGGQQAVSVSVQSGNGRIYHSHPVSLANVSFEDAVKIALAKAQGREEGQLELDLSQSTQHKQTEAGK